MRLIAQKYDYPTKNEKRDKTVLAKEMVMKARTQTLVFFEKRQTSLYTKKNLIMKTNQEFVFCLSQTTTTGAQDLYKFLKILPQFIFDLRPVSRKQLRGIVVMRFLSHCHLLWSCEDPGGGELKAWRMRELSEKLR